MESHEVDCDGTVRGIGVRIRDRRAVGGEVQIRPHMRRSFRATAGRSRECAAAKAMRDEA